MPRDLSRAVFAWGEGEDGQLGIATLVKCPDDPDAEPFDTYLCKPTWIPALHEIRLRNREFGRSPVVGGSRGSVAIGSEGEVYAWGWNQRGSLGLGHKLTERVPRKVDHLGHVKVVQAAVGGWHCLALGSQGEVYAWGGNEYTQCAVEQTALDKEERRDVCLPIPILPMLKVQQVAAGGMHSLALTQDGEVWTWGQPLCNFKHAQSRLPAPVPLPSSRRVKKIAAGAFHNAAVQENGVVLTWGHNEYGTLGLGNATFVATPTPVAFFTDNGLEMTDVACGGWHMSAISSGGDLYVWGRGEYGRLGLGPDCSSKMLPTALHLPNDEGVTQVSCGGTHTLFLTRSQRVYTCGRGTFGRQALGECAYDCTTPVQVKFEGGPWTALSVSAGGRHSIAVVKLRDRRASIAGHASDRSLNSSASQGHLVPVVTTPEPGTRDVGTDQEIDVPIPVSFEQSSPAQKHGADSELTEHKGA
mmetsp:Transcript_27994/g.61263  ORF Transcript_27994/g.61263 Transcript_27994/m.61263 type:complete len:471 (-) Transcript_27994:159-1571(-)